VIFFGKYLWSISKFQDREEGQQQGSPRIVCFLRSLTAVGSRRNAFNSRQDILARSRCYRLPAFTSNPSFPLVYHRPRLLPRLTSAGELEGSDLQRDQHLVSLSFIVRCFGSGGRTKPMVSLSAWNKSSPSRPHSSGASWIAGRHMEFGAFSLWVQTEEICVRCFTWFKGSMETTLALVLISTCTKTSPLVSTKSNFDRGAATSAHQWSRVLDVLFD
jgi:hypothetical protein